MSIGIIDDHFFIRQAIKIVFEKTNMFGFFEAENGEDMIDKLKKTSILLLPSILIVDINMPKMDGFKTVEWLKEHYPKIKIIILTMRNDDEAIVKMLQLGVNSYLSKSTINSEGLLKAVKAVQEQGYYYTDDITKVLVDSLASGNKLNNSHNTIQSLSEKEKSVIKLICEEMTSSEISDVLKISPRTVENIVVGIFSKIDVKSRVGLALFAQKNDLLA